MKNRYPFTVQIPNIKKFLPLNKPCYYYKYESHTCHETVKTNLFPTSYIICTSCKICGFDSFNSIKHQRYKQNGEASQNSADIHRSCQQWICEARKANSLQHQQSNFDTHFNFFNTDFLSSLIIEIVCKPNVHL